MEVRKRQQHGMTGYYSGGLKTLKTLKDSTSRLNNRTGCNVSERTVRRRFSSDGYRRCIVSKRIII